MRSSRRIALFERPLTSARRREIGAASSRRPSRSASRTSSIERDATVRTGWTAHELDYDLPRELIAQEPAAGADASRLLVYRRATGEVDAPTSSASCPELVGPTLAVVNDTRVVPARIPIERPRGEVLLLEHARRRRVGGARAADAAPARGADATAPVELLEHLGEGRWRVRLDGEPAGATPLPPYITAPLERRRALPDGLRARTRLGRGADGGPALHAGAPRAARRRARHAARRPRHVPAAAGRGRRGARDPRRAVRGRGGRVGADPSGAERVLAVGTTTVRVLETLAARRARSPGAPSSSSRRASSSAASTTC